ncbi:MAG: bifunctional riboflavin kinase/FAD synthetase [Candidatus Omnitrophica bacterium]|nr:bifunctional riboflavin kinase/FAD synthetase [Candidatus Omnitrophota bacterium]MDD5488672.1 bifunctional riboflavin kinase/FAD synthetase [Candidatus Omnitrophota bacterium]
MKLLYGYRSWRSKLKAPVACIGIFDGVHLGHRKVIARTMAFNAPGRDRIVITFDPHPRNYFSSRNDPPRIMSLEHRLSIFEKMGLDAAVVINFSEAIASMAPEDFVEKVLVGMGVGTVFAGSNFYFGAGKKGSIKELAKIGKKFGIQVKSVPPVKRDGKIVSSTWIRDLISKGDLVRAKRLLGRPVSVLGTVVSGDKRGRRFGIPTANIDPHHEVIPPPGVYAVDIPLGGRSYGGVLNIGFKPTFYGNKLKARKEPCIEAHIPGFSGDLYGRHIEIFFLSRIRGERRFSGEDKLKEQIEKDISAAKGIFRKAGRLAVNRMT